nr:hypothetical protein [bacterium]
MMMIQDGRKIMGLDKNIAMGLSYLIPLIALIAVLTDKGLDTDEKAMLWSSVFNAIAASITCGVFYIFAIIAAIKSFMGDYSFKLPLMYNLGQMVAGKL